MPLADLLRPGRQVAAFAGQLARRARRDARVVATLAEAAEAVPAQPAHPDVCQPEAWPQARISRAEELWGEGFLAPGGREEILRLAVPLGLSAASSLLLLGAGAGGPPRTLATDLNVWVTCLERDASLRELAARRIQRAGAPIAKRATVGAWDPASPDFKENAYHHALALEACGTAPPEPILAALAQAIRPSGQLVLVELVADQPLDAADSDISAWCALEHRPPHLPATGSITSALSSLGFDIRVIEDQSQRHAALAMRGWMHRLRLMRGRKPAPADALNLVIEAELWLRRIRLLQEERIRLIRWHAFAHGP
jgi:cyclopropane fatty-acyl-phospholipid synthase-like methyltransferase